MYVSRRKDTMQEPNFRWSEWTNCTCSDGGCYQYSYRQRRDCHGDGQERGLEPGFHTDWWPMECKISQLNGTCISFINLFVK